MRKTFWVIACLLTTVTSALCEERFGRPVVKLKSANDYQVFKLDEVNYPSLSDDSFTVSCLVYRGALRYYVEVTVMNKTSSPVALPLSFVTFDKPGFSLYRTDTMLAAREAAISGGVQFVPTAAPYVPPTYHTTVNATATTYGNQTSLSGTATTTADYSGQAGATFGNAVGNAIAAHRFYKMQRNDVALSHYLLAHIQTDADTPIGPGQSRTVVATFEQAKQKKKDCSIDIKLADDSFKFAYKE